MTSRRKTRTPRTKTTKQPASTAMKAGPSPPAKSGLEKEADIAAPKKGGDSAPATAVQADPKEAEANAKNSSVADVPELLFAEDYPHKWFIVGVPAGEWVKGTLVPHQGWHLVSLGSVLKSEAVDQAAKRVRKASGPLVQGQRTLRLGDTPFGRGRVVKR